jgi:hypothetical protein
MEDILREPVELTTSELDAVAGGYYVVGSHNWDSFNGNGNGNGNVNGNGSGNYVWGYSANGNENGNGNGNITIG